MRSLPVLLNTICGFLLSLVCHGQNNESLQSTGGLQIGGNYTEAQRLFEKTKYEQALIICDQALDDRFPVQIYNRIQATATRCCLLLSRRKDALQRIESIHKRNSASPYLSLIPLVWDIRLPTNERYMAPIEDLHSESPTRRLAAASSLLHESQHADHCVAILMKVQADQSLPMSLMAETQLWRIQMPRTDSVHLQTVRRWQKRAATLPKSLRAGPQFVVGRAFQLRHKPNQASLEFLWLPLMQTDDPFLAASGLAETIVCLEATGRTESSRRLREELLDRFSKTSAARRLSNPGSHPATAVPFQQ